MYIVYILYLSNGNLYKGYTEDLPERIKAHSEGRVRSTRPFRPIQLIHHECYRLKSDATRREKFLKTTEGKRLLRMQLRDLLAALQGDSEPQRTRSSAG